MLLVYLALTSTDEESLPNRVVAKTSACAVATHHQGAGQHDGECADNTERSHPSVIDGHQVSVSDMVRPTIGPVATAGSSTAGKARRRGPRVSRAAAVTSGLAFRGGPSSSRGASRTAARPLGGPHGRRRGWSPPRSPRYPASRARCPVPAPDSRVGLPQVYVVGGQLYLHSSIPFASHTPSS